MQLKSALSLLAITSSARVAAAPVSAARARGQTGFVRAGRRVGALLLCALSAGVSAQSHEVRREGVVLRSSTVASDRIDAATARLHGIEPSPDRAVLNVVVLSAKAGDQATLPAQVSASTRNLAGVRHDIEMREVRENDRVSYIGSYSFVPREVLDFEITARPTGATRQKPVTLKYRDRMWAR